MRPLALQTLIGVLLAAHPVAASTSCPTAPGNVADEKAREIVDQFRQRFERDVRVPDWCFASDDDYGEVSQRLVTVCRERPGDAHAEALALVALKIGRCAGFEAGRRSTLGEPRGESRNRFGVRPEEGSP